VTIIDRFSYLFCRKITQFLHGTYGNLCNHLYAFMISYSVYPTGHPLIINCGDAKMRCCFRRKRGHKLNCVGESETVLTPKVKSKMCSVKRACLFVMLHIALNMTTKVLNSWDCEQLELTFFAIISQISRDGRHALSATRNVVKFSR